MRLYKIGWTIEGVKGVFEDNQVYAEGVVDKVMDLLKQTNPTHHYYKTLMLDTSDEEEVE